jgi:protein farnesyltransferase/geranylgeranyltransferase type-1 subunit alpha
MSETQYEEFVPFNDRPEWNDITPVEQDEGPNPIVPIAYSHECTFKN